MRAPGGGAADAIVDVAVVGGGLVGAAAALAAGQAGLSVAWVVGDASSAPSMPTTPRDERVYALSPATRRFLDRLRVWPQLDASRLAPVFAMDVHGDREGRSAIRFDAYEAATERLATIVEHRELARVLGAAAGYFPGIERIDGAASQVVVGPAFATVGTTRGDRAARLVVAADGAQSSVRESQGFTTHRRPYAQRALVGHFATTRSHGGTAFQWFTDDGVVALLPLAALPGEPHAMSLVWSAPDAVADRLIADGAAAIAARLSTLCAAQPKTAIGPLTAASGLVAIPLSLQWSERLVADRIALVGDAAHVVHPLAGQGLNLGFGDVETLVDVLAAREPFRDCGDRVLLRRYERARAEPVAAMRQSTDGLARLFASERRDVAALRGLGLALFDRAAPLKRFLMRQAAGGVGAD